MNKEEYTIKLDMVATFENKQVIVENLLEKLFKENKQLKDNWNKLKGYLEHSIDFERIYTANSLEDIYGEILDKMQELEKGDSNE